MTWYITAKNRISEEEINLRIKDIIREGKFFAKMFDAFGVSIDRIDKHLNFHVVDMDGKHAQSKKEDIFLDNKLLNDESFFDTQIHFVVHELIHWLTRQREKDCYFADPEEIEAFTHAIAYEILRGEHDERLRKTFFPIIEAHFDEATNANLLFKALLAKAHLKADSWRSHYN